MKKRMLALLLTLCMVVSLLPARMVLAEGTETEVTWSISLPASTAKVGDTMQVSVAASNGEAITEDVDWSTDTPEVVGSIEKDPSDPTRATVTFSGTGDAHITAKSTAGAAEDTVTVTVEGASQNTSEPVALPMDTATTAAIGASGEVCFVIPQVAAGTYMLEITAHASAYGKVIEDSTQVSCYEGAFQGESVDWDLELSADSYTVVITGTAGAEVTAKVSLVQLREDTPVEEIPSLIVDEPATATPNEMGFVKYWIIVPESGAYTLTTDCSGAYSVYLTQGETEILNPDDAVSGTNTWEVELEALASNSLLLYVPDGEQITTTLSKVGTPEDDEDIVEPASISFKCDPIVLYMDAMAFPIFPDYAPHEADFDESKVEFSFGDTSIATMQEGCPTGVKPGKTTITAKYGELTATAALEVRENIALPLDQAVKEKTNQNTDIYYNVTVPADGDYLLSFESGNQVFISMYNTPGMEQDFSGAPTTEMAIVLHLKGGVENMVRIQGWEPNQEVYALLTTAPVSDEMTSVGIAGNGGTFKWVEGLGWAEDTTDNTGKDVYLGKTLKSMGTSVSDPVYWTTRAFQGWEVCFAQLLGEGEYDWENRQELGVFTTAEMLSLELDKQGMYEITAKWEGDDADYGSWIDLWTLDVEMTMASADGSESWTTNSYGVHLWENGTTIGAQDNGRVTNVPSHPDYGAFQGWMMTKHHVDTEIYELLDEKIYTSEEVFAMKAPKDDLCFIAKWEGVDPADYVNCFHVNIRTTEELKPIVMELNTKYTVVMGNSHLYSFTAPQTGMYTWKTDMEEVVLMEVLREDGVYSYDTSSTRPQTMELKQGDAVEFTGIAYGTGGFWVEKTNLITGAKVVSQNTSKSYLGGNNFNPYNALQDVQLEVTFADGTTKTMTGKDFVNYGRNAVNGQPTDISWIIAEDEKSADITMICDKVQLTVTVKLMSDTITKLEIIPSTEVKYYENSLGWIDFDGAEEFFYYDLEPMMLLSTYQITWASGKVETFQPDLEAEAPLEYMGLMIYGDGMQYDAHWSVGKNTVIVYLGDVQTSFQVEILESTVKDIEVQAMGTTQYILGDPAHFVAFTNGWNLREADISGLKLKINYKDGTSKVVTDADVSDFGLLEGVPLYVYGSGYYTKAGTYELYVEYMGKTDTVDIQIVEKIVANDAVTVSPSIVEKELLSGKPITEVVVDATSGTAAGVPAVNMPASSVKNVADANAAITVKMDAAQVTVSQKAVETIAQNAGEEAQVSLTVASVKAETLTSAQQKLIQQVVAETKLTAEPVVLDITLTVDGTPITNFGGMLTIRVPFAVPEGAKGEDFDVYYLSDDGNVVQKMATTFVVAADGSTWLEFTTDHLSDYVALNGEPEGAEDYVPGTGAGTGSGSGTDTGTGSGSTGAGTEPVPNTGDTSKLYAFGAMLLLSGMMTVAMLVLRKKFRV